MRVESLLFFLFASFLAAQQAPAPQATKPEEAEKQFALVEGKLIDASSGEPVRKANLVLMQMPSGTAILTAPPPSVAAATDAELGSLRLS